MTKNNKYIFWSDDPSILYKNNKYLEFVPTVDMTRVEQLNAITRFSIYFLILACITNKSEIWIQLPILIIIFTYVLFLIYDSDNSGKLHEIEKFINSEKSVNLINKVKSKSDSDIILEAGDYNEQNKLVTDKYQSSKQHNSYKQHNKHSFDKFNEYLKATCRKPTPDNPFMNTTINDFGIELPPQACNIDDDDIQEKINDSFNQDLFMDVSDLFERQNSQRQFYAIPNSNPPDTIGFANWLYSPESTCKINQSKCGAFEDLRYNR